MTVLKSEKPDTIVYLKIRFIERELSKLSKHFKLAALVKKMRQQFVPIHHCSRPMTKYYSLQKGHTDPFTREPQKLPGGEKRDPVIGEIRPKFSKFRGRS
jgi:hypothetical protein